MVDNYWNGKGKFQEQFQRLSEELVPFEGKCETLAGEMIRAATRLTYDFYNNGMGNDTSAAIKFLKSYIDSDVYKTIKPFTRGRLYKGNYGRDGLHMAMILMMDAVVECIINNPQTLIIPNFEYCEEAEYA